MDRVSLEIYRSNKKLDLKLVAIPELPTFFNDYKRDINQEEKFRSCFFNAPFPMMIHAEDGEVLEINKILTELSGYTVAEIPTINDWIRVAFNEDLEGCTSPLKRTQK